MSRKTRAIQINETLDIYPGQKSFTGTVRLLKKVIEPLPEKSAVSVRIFRRKSLHSQQRFGVEKSGVPFCRRFIIGQKQLNHRRKNVISAKIVFTDKNIIGCFCFRILGINIGRRKDLPCFQAVLFNEKVRKPQKKSQRPFRPNTQKS